MSTDPIDIMNTASGAALGSMIPIPCLAPVATSILTAAKNETEKKAHAYYTASPCSQDQADAKQELDDHCKNQASW